MLHRFIAVLGVVVACCVAAAPAFAVVETGGFGGQPLTLCPVGADPLYDFSLTDSTLNLSATGTIYATANGDSYDSYSISGGSIIVTSGPQNLVNSQSSAPLMSVAPIVSPPRLHMEPTPETVMSITTSFCFRTLP